MTAEPAAILKLVARLRSAIVTRPRATAFTVFATLLVPLLIAAPSLASSGSFTAAHHDSTFTRGTFAGSVTWDGCVRDPCTWIPIIVANPSLPSYRCLETDWRDSDPNTRQVTSLGQRTGNTTIAFNVPLAEGYILNGVQGQRACLIVVETQPRQSPVCIVQAPILGMDPTSCPYDPTISEYVMADQLMTPLPPPPAPPTTPAPAPAPTLKTTSARKAAKAALAKKFGRSYKKGAKHKLSCSRKSATRIVCKASWRYKTKKRKGTVTLDLVAGRVKAKARK